MSMAAGPAAVQATAVAVTTSEAVIATMPPGNWAGSNGALVTASLNYSPSASATAVVLRVRQAGVAGALVGVARTVTVANPNSFELMFNELDNSAYGLAQQGGVYVLTAQGTGAGGTANIVTLSLETTSPVS
jgi:hypothetical protein